MNKFSINIDYKDKDGQKITEIYEHDDFTDIKGIGYDRIFEEIDEYRYERPELEGNDVLDIRIKLPIDKDLGEFWEKFRKVFNI